MSSKINPLFLYCPENYEKKAFFALIFIVKSDNIMNADSAMYMEVDL